MEVGRGRCGLRLRVDGRPLLSRRGCISFFGSRSEKRTTSQVVAERDRFCGDAGRVASKKNDLPYGRGRIPGAVQEEGARALSCNERSCVRWSARQGVVDASGSSADGTHAGFLRQAEGRPPPWRWLQEGAHSLLDPVHRSPLRPSMKKLGNESTVNPSALDKILRRPFLRNPWVGFCVRQRSLHLRMAKR